MMWTLLREISLRHLRHAPLRTALTVFGIGLGVCVLCAMLTMNATLEAAFEDMVDRVAGRADLTVGGGESGLANTLTAEIADVDGVEHAAAMLEVVTRSPRLGGGTLLVLGVDLLGDTYFLPFAQAGEHQVVEDPLAFVNDATALLITRKLAEAHGLKVGDELPLVTSLGTKSFFIRGLLEDEGPAASYGGQVVVMFLDAAQVSFARGESVDRIDVVTAKGLDVTEVKQRIETKLEGRVRVEQPTGRARRLYASLDVFRNGLNTTGVIALGVGAFLIYNAVSVSVAQRRRELGILRALGVTRGKLIQLFCLEGLVMAALGSVIGLVLAKHLAAIVLDSVVVTVTRVYVAIRPDPPELSAHTAAYGMLAGFFATLVASYVPARAANRVDPAEVLRSTRPLAFVAPRSSRKLVLLGLAFVCASPVLALAGTENSGYASSISVMIGCSLMAPAAVRLLCAALVRIVERTLGVPGRLALDNVDRSLGRSVSIVIALMLAIATSMTVGAWAASFERSITQWVDDALPCDAMVSAGSPTLDRNHLPLPPSLVEELKTTPGVAAVNPIRNLSSELGSRRVAVEALDTRVHLGEGEKRGAQRQVLEGPDRLHGQALYEAPRVIISANLAHFGRLGVGDEIRLDTPSGPRPFAVHAVVVDYSSDQGWLMVDQRWYAEYWGETPIDAVEVYFTLGSDPEQLAQQLRQRLAHNGSIFVTSHQALRDELRGVARAIFAYAKAPELISLVVAIMGVIGTMLAVVIDRIREIGMLRAIGATRGQVTVSMITEAAFLGFAAVACGVLAGIPQGLVFIRVIGFSSNGWELPYVFPVDTALRVGGFVIGAAALAGFLPGRRAAGLDVKEALAYE